MATPTRRRLTPSGYPLQKAEREKLNDERGIKPLPVSRSRDGAGPGTAWPGGVRGRFCILSPEISPAVGLQTVPRREPLACLVGLDAKTSYRRDCCSEESD